MCPMVCGLRLWLSLCFFGCIAMHVGDMGSWFPDQNQTPPPASGAQSLNCWTAREIPWLFFNTTGWSITFNTWYLLQDVKLCKLWNLLFLISVDLAIHFSEVLLCPSECQSSISPMQLGRIWWFFIKRCYQAHNLN